MMLQPKTFRLIGVRTDGARITLCVGISTLERATRMQELLGQDDRFGQVLIENDGTIGEKFPQGLFFSRGGHFPPTT